MASRWWIRFLSWFPRMRRMAQEVAAPPPEPDPEEDEDENKTFLVDGRPEEILGPSSLTTISLERVGMDGASSGVVQLAPVDDPTMELDMAGPPPPPRGGRSTSAGEDRIVGFLGPPPQAVSAGHQLGHGGILERAQLLSLLVAELITVTRTLEEAGASPVDLALVRTISDRAARNDLNLPRFPEIARQVEELTTSPEVSLKDIANVVDRDPEIVRQVWSAASAVGFTSPPVSVHHAIVRLGLEAIWRLAMRSTLLFMHGEHPRYEDAAEEVRRHSRVVAEVAGGLSGQPRGSAFLAGLLHAVGRLVVLRSVSEFTTRDRIPSRETIELIAARSHAILGAILAVDWRMPPEVAYAILYHQAWKSAPDEARELTGLVSLADLAAWATRPAEEDEETRDASDDSGEDGQAEVREVMAEEDGAVDPRWARARDLATQAWATIL